LARDSDDFHGSDQAASIFQVDLVECDWILAGEFLQELRGRSRFEFGPQEWIGRRR
jgi:hypothetical protein